MIALIILGVIFLILAFILLLPINLFLRFDNELFIKVKLAGIKVFDSNKIEAKEKEHKPKETEKTKENGLKTFFSKLSEKYGYLGAVKKVINLIGKMLSHIKKLLRHIKIKKVILNLVVVGEDAAATAVEYGAICSAVYPLLSFLDSCAKVDFKNINVTSGFEYKKSHFDFSLVCKLRIIFLLIALIGIFKEYKNFSEEEEKQWVKIV